MAGKPGKRKGVKKTGKAVIDKIMGKEPDTCSNCYSHREGNITGLYSGKPVCHFNPVPEVCRSANHWCRQWEAEGGKAGSGLDTPPELRTEADPQPVA